MFNQEKRNRRFQRNNDTQVLVITALMIALTYVATWLINIRLPFAGSGGLVHLGNVPLFVAAMLFGKKTGALAGGIGMGLFDLLSGWTVWAPFTFVIVGLMGFETGWFAEKHPLPHRSLNDSVSLVLALLIKVIGYYFAEVILYHNWIAPFGSIPGNILQVGTAALIVLAIMPVLRKVKIGVTEPVRQSVS
uniref:ECF transporter S component n=1 Tax=Eubacterium cellulosolvens TaxID=29322 RepID=UPI00068841A7|nr:ECF transporter S component [[Eubacterium] cellulosolvens]